MKLFGFRAGRDPSRPALSSSVSRSGVPLTADWPRSYETQVREGYLGNAVAQRAVRLSDRSPATLLGYPVAEAEDMPDVAANSLSIAFGNFRLGYLIAERAETAILRDPYSNKPFVSFYATKRVGGCVVNGEAIKVMRFSAT
jgi:hypothetical protein